MRVYVVARWVVARRWGLRGGLEVGARVELLYAMNKPSGAIGLVMRCGTTRRRAQCRRSAAGVRGWPTAAEAVARAGGRCARR